MLNEQPSIFCCLGRFEMLCLPHHIHSRLDIGLRELTEITGQPHGFFKVSFLGRRIEAAATEFGVSTYSMDRCRPPNLTLLVYDRAQERVLIPRYRAADLFKLSELVQRRALEDLVVLYLLSCGGESDTKEHLLPHRIVFPEDVVRFHLAVSQDALKQWNKEDRSLWLVEPGGFLVGITCALDKQIFKLDVIEFDAPSMKN